MKLETTRLHYARLYVNLVCMFNNWSTRGRYCQVHKAVIVPLISFHSFSGQQHLNPLSPPGVSLGLLNAAPGGCHRYCNRLYSYINYNKQIKNNICRQ